jgi:hypothetical protein
MQHQNEKAIPNTSDLLERIGAKYVVEHENGRRPFLRKLQLLTDILGAAFLVPNVSSSVQTGPSFSPVQGGFDIGLHFIPLVVIRSLTIVIYGSSINPHHYRVFCKLSFPPGWI